MKRYLINIGVFSIPFGLYLILVFVVDPYNYLNRYEYSDDTIKNNISKGVQPHLYKLIDYDNHPKKNIALGDSRTNALFHHIPEDQWANLAFDGGSLKELIETFWYATEREKLDTVLISVNLRLFNKYHKRFWVEETIERKRNFFSYAFSKYTFKSTMYYLSSMATGEEYQFNNPSMSKDEFWDFQLKRTAAKFFEKHEHPDEYYNELKKIAVYCKEHEIKLIFWIPPTHIDFQQRIIDFNLEDAQQIFTEEIASIGHLHNFNVPGNLTINKDDYADPVHFNEGIGAKLYELIFKEKR